MLILLVGPPGTFQTLPGIIPRFYLETAEMMPSPFKSFKPFQGLFRVSTKEDSDADPSESKFQTLPGIIPRFYGSVVGGNDFSFFSFQTLPGIIPRFYHR
ncbi:hypothetical protein U27_01539 [Candidatus Vecturithrix granuli]|uniref:Uncharacterized protein n=1 Tax=Vecturithrix granuli TaxID=1499967 RepID=A0A081CAN3_VECG1|nr:hypothetical protein U27_01539 [Candidatus Vecturithrix granuli]